MAAPTILRAEADIWNLTSMEAFAPYNYSRNGIYQGIDVEILDTAARDMGVTLRHHPLPWRRAMLTFDKGEVDGLFQVTVTETRLTSWRMVGPLRMTRIVYVTRADSPLRDIATPVDLQDLTVGVVRGFTYGEGFERMDHFRRERSLDEETSLRKLLLGRCDVAVIGQSNAHYVSDMLGIRNALRVLPTPLVEEGRYIAFHRDARGMALADRLQPVLDRMHADGRIDRILARPR